jgi:hypothetical protein
MAPCRHARKKIAKNFVSGWWWWYYFRDAVPIDTKRDARQECYYIKVITGAGPEMRHRAMFCNNFRKQFFEWIADFFRKKIYTNTVKDAISVPIENKYRKVSETIEMNSRRPSITFSSFLLGTLSKAGFTMTKYSRDTLVFLSFTGFFQMTWWGQNSTLTKRKYPRLCFWKSWRRLLDKVITIDNGLWETCKIPSMNGRNEFVMGSESLSSMECKYRWRPNRVTLT